MHNSWIWLYDDRVFKEKLYKSIQETHIYPVVIVQKRSTIGNNWPDNQDVADVGNTPADPVHLLLILVYAKAGNSC